jgi:hypothetical protein
MKQPKKKAVPPKKKAVPPKKKAVPPKKKAVPLKNKKPAKAHAQPPIISDDCVFASIHRAGLINQMTSFELMFIMAFITQRQFYIYNSMHPPGHPAGREHIPEKRRKMYAGSTNPNILDLIFVPKGISVAFDPRQQKDLERTVLKGLTEDDEVLNPTTHYYIKGDKKKKNKTEKAFANGRKELLAHIKDIKHPHFNKWCFGYYSCFVYKRSKKLDRFISSIKFRGAYTQLAAKIAESLGDFVGGQIRLTDHAKNYLPPQAILDPAIRDSVEIFKKNNKGLKFIVATDDNTRVMEDIGIDCILIDDVIEEFSEDFQKLPFHNEVVFGLICLLVLSYSKEFIGTPGSTYSAYIDRMRINRGLKRGSVVKTGNPKDDFWEPKKQFEWQDHPRCNHFMGWWYEWPECKLSA